MRVALETQLSLDILERAWAAILISTRGTGPPVPTPRFAKHKRIGRFGWLVLHGYLLLSNVCRAPLQQSPGP